MKNKHRGYVAIPFLKKQDTKRRRQDDKKETKKQDAEGTWTKIRH